MISMNYEIDYPLEYQKIVKNFRKILKAKINHSQGITQSDIGKLMQKSQNAINNWLTENKKYQCLPNAVDFLILSKILDLDFNLFFQSSSFLSEIFEKNNHFPERSTDRGLLPFIRTSVSRKIELIFDQAISTTNLTIIETVKKNGSTRALLEFVQHNPSRAIYITEVNSLDALVEQIVVRYKVSSISEWLSTQRVLILIDHADVLPKSQLECIIGYFFNKQPLVFIRKDSTRHNQILENESKRYILPAIIRDDLHALCRGVLPGISREALVVLEMLARGRMDDLAALLGKLRSACCGKTALSQDRVLEILIPA